MKNLYNYFIAFFIFAFLTNCTSVKTNIIEVKGLSRISIPVIDTTRIVIKFNGLSDSEIKEQLDSLPVKKDDENIERCQCGDPNLVQLKWDYDNFTKAEIQTARNSLTGRRGTAQGDTPFTFSLPLNEGNPYILTDYDRLGKKKLEWLKNLPALLTNTPTQDFSVNIAVLDTGIDFYKNRDMNPFLYSTENLVGECEDQISGWNFVDKSNNITDNHGHGTYVTRLITSSLEEKDVPYRILPIKVFNAKGKGDYWDIICALSYVNEVQRKSLYPFIVNASWGYSFFGTQISDYKLKDYKEFSIARELIEDLEQSTVFVASAGNAIRNIDVHKQENFPASFTSENLIGVGGYVVQDETRMTDGNYGPISIDVAAPYTDYQFTFNNKLNVPIENVTLTGSSYAAAFTTSNIADLIGTQPEGDIASPDAIKTEFYDVGKGWLKIDTGLIQKISNGKYQEY